MIKYRTKWDKIEAHEVLRETEKMVVLAPKSSANTYSREVKEAKRSDWQNWHDTWEAAHAFLVEQAQREVDSLRMRLEQAKGRLGNIKGMVPNDGGQRQADSEAGGLSAGPDCWASA